jgi:hypothetical protein
MTRNLFRVRQSASLGVNAQADAHADWVAPEGASPRADNASESGTASRQPNGKPEISTGHSHHPPTQGTNMHQIWLQVYAINLEKYGHDKAIEMANEAVEEASKPQPTGLLRWLWSLIY